MIKNSFTLIFCLEFFALTACGQNCVGVKKMHAWFQPVTQGNASKADQEKQGKKGNYFIYIESESDLVLSSIWINGKTYYGKLKRVKSPVMLENFTGENPPQQNEKKQLVPFTNRKLFQVLFAGKDSSQVTQKRPPAYGSKPVVIRFAIGKKYCYATLGEIKQLNPVGLF